MEFLDPVTKVVVILGMIQFVLFIAALVWFFSMANDVSAIKKLLSEIIRNQNKY